MTKEYVLSEIGEGEASMRKKHDPRTCTMTIAKSYPSASSKRAVSRIPALMFRHHISGRGSDTHIEHANNEMGYAVVQLCNVKYLKIFPKKFSDEK